MKIKIISVCIIAAVLVTSVLVTIHKRKEEKIAKEKAAIEKVIKKADRQAAMYDYDSAISIVKDYGTEKYEGGFEEKPELAEAIARYESEKASLISLIHWILQNLK
mgnify:CR=1 FL=1